MVDAPAAVRYQRAIDRKRIENISTLDEFIQMDWKGDSARQFNDIFKQFVEVELIRLQELKQLSAKLNNEIAQWQETGAGLGMG